VLHVRRRRWRRLLRGLRRIREVVEGLRRRQHQSAPRIDDTAVFVWYRDPDDTEGLPFGRVPLMMGPFRQSLLFGFASRELAEDFRSRLPLGMVTLRTLAEVRAAEGDKLTVRSLFVFTSVEQTRLWQCDKQRFGASIVGQIRDLS
jgi:hypothetical protein